jgi:ABC-type glycerol-3-phosphate transport system substrate-binding protein
MSKNVDHLRLSRRGLIKATGGIAGAAALAGPFANLGLHIAEAQNTVTITIWGNHPEWKDPMQQILDAFQAANPDIKMELTELEGATEYPAKLQTSIAGGQPSDVLGDAEGNIIVRVAAGGDLPYIDLTGKVDVSQLTDTARLQVEVGGKVYGCPLAAYTVGLAIQNPIFAKHNLTPPTTWDELKMVAQKLKDAGETPIVLGAKDWVHTYFMYIGLASSVLGPDGLNAVRTGERKLTDPDVVAAVQLLLDLQPFYNEGFQATDYTTAKAIFANGKGAMMVAGTADFTGYRQVNPKADLSFVAWPGPEAGKKATTTGMELLYTASRFSSADKQAAATKFVAWLATKDAQQLVSDKIALPINKEVTGSSDPIRAQTVTAAQGGDVPVWYDLPELNQSTTAVQNNQGGLWTGRLNAQQFAEAMQAIVKPSGASTATPTA